MLSLSRVLLGKDINGRKVGVYCFRLMNYVKYLDDWKCQLV